MRRIPEQLITSIAVVGSYDDVQAWFDARPEFDNVMFEGEVVTSRDTDGSLHITRYKGVHSVYPDPDAYDDIIELCADCAAEHGEET